MRAELEKRNMVSSENVEREKRVMFGQTLFDDVATGRIVLTLSFYADITQSEGTGGRQS